MSLAVEVPANSGIWITDFARNDIWASDQWRARFGFACRTAGTCQRFARVHPEDREPLHQTLANVLERGGDYETEYRILLPDGRTRWM